MYKHRYKYKYTFKILCLKCFSAVHYLVLHERFERKQGLSSLLYLKCSASSCRYTQEFFTSAKVQRFWN